MKKTLIINIILTIGFFASQAFSQVSPEISADKKQVIEEIIKSVRAEEQMKATMEKMFEQMENVYPAVVDSMIDGQENLTVAEKTKLKAEMIERNAEISKRFNQKFLNVINYPEFLEQVFYPLYDKFFTVEELKDLLAFYKTPTGQKFNNVIPEFSAESIRLSQIYLIPKIDGLLKELINESLKNNGKGDPPPPAPKKSRK